MSSEFDESEMYPCDICGEFWPMGEMYELEDGSVICPDCMENNILPPFRKKKRRT